MYKNKRAILRKAVIVTCLTIIGAGAMIVLKDWTLKSEAMKAMGQLGKAAIGYKQQHGVMPSKEYVKDIKGKLEGSVRMGDVKYRARWISIDSGSDTILAYSKIGFHSFFFSPGYIVLRLDGGVEWMGVGEFEELLKKQQDPLEMEIGDVD